jgi:hypothetical protein
VLQNILSVVGNAASVQIVKKRFLINFTRHKEAKMTDQRLMTMIIVSNILSAYYGNKASFCATNNKEPNDAEKEDLLRRVITMFENLSTSYLKDIEEIAEGTK